MKVSGSRRGVRSPFSLLVTLCLSVAFWSGAPTGALADDADPGPGRSLLTAPVLLDFPDSPRQKLAKQGITLGVHWTHFYQGMLAGEGEKDFQYGGKVDLFARFDMSKLGLWNGFSISMHGEILHGEDANSLGEGSLVPINTALALPRLGGYETDFSILFTQTFGKRTSLTVGKFNMLVAASRTPLVGGGGLNTFMNIALAAPVSGVTPPYLIGGSLSHRFDFATVSFMVYDPRNAQGTAVLEDLFGDGVTFSLSATVPTKIGGATLLNSFRGVYSTQEGTNLRDIPQLILPSGSPARVGARKGYWYGGYSFQLILHQNAKDPTKQWGLFGQIGVSDGNPNPFAFSAFVGFAGNDLIPTRPLDRVGIAYHYSKFSDSLTDGLRPLIRIGAQQGVELFYNAAITPWLRATVNLQVIDPFITSRPTAVLLGFRTQIRF